MESSKKKCGIFLFFIFCLSFSIIAKMIPIKISYTHAQLFAVNESRNNELNEKSEREIERKISVKFFWASKCASPMSVCAWHFNIWSCFTCSIPEKKEFKKKLTWAVPLLFVLDLLFFFFSKRYTRFDLNWFFHCNYNAVYAAILQKMFTVIWKWVDLFLWTKRIKTNNHQCSSLSSTFLICPF